MEMALNVTGFFYSRKIKKKHCVRENDPKIAVDKKNLFKR